MYRERRRQSESGDADWKAKLAERDMRPPVSARPPETSRHGDLRGLFADSDSVEAERLRELREELGGDDDQESLPDVHEPIPKLQLPEYLFSSSGDIDRDVLMQRAEEVAADLLHLREERKQRLRKKGHVEIANLGSLNALIDSKKEELAQLEARAEAGGPALDFSFLHELDDPEQAEIDRHLEQLIDEHIRTAAEQRRVGEDIETLWCEREDSAALKETEEDPLDALLARQSELRRTLLELDQAIEDVREGESLMLTPGFETEPEEATMTAEYGPEMVDPSVEYARIGGELARLDLEIDDAVEGTDRQILEELLREWYTLGSSIGELAHVFEAAEGAAAPASLHEDLSVSVYEKPPREEMREIVTKTRELRGARSLLSDAEEDISDAEARNLSWSLIPALLDWRAAKRDIIRLEQELFELEHIGPVIDIEGPLGVPLEADQDYHWEQIVGTEVEDEEGEPPADVEDEVDELETGEVSPGMHIEEADVLGESDIERAFFDRPAEDEERASEVA